MIHEGVNDDMLRDDRLRDDRLRDDKVRVHVQVASGVTGVPAARRFVRWVKAARPGPCEVTIRVLGSREGATINHRFRGRTGPTNVLSFSYGKQQGRLLGDLALCAPVVRREAREQRKPVDAHYAHLVVHGVLHLRGYDHETDGEATRMERAEKRILASLGYANPYLAT